MIELSTYTQLSNHGCHQKPEIRNLLLARLLTRILETRVMVKSCPVRQAVDSPVARLLRSRERKH
jgi:hypothetical protein